MEAVEETLTALVAEIKTLRKQVKTLTAKGGNGKRAPTAFNLYMKEEAKKLQKKHPKWTWGKCWSTAAGVETRGDAYEVFKETNGIVAKTKKAPKKVVVSDSESDEEVAPKKKAPKKKVVVEDSDSDSDSDSEEETPPPKKTVKALKKKVVVEESETDEEEVAPPACE